MWKLGFSFHTAIQITVWKFQDFALIQISREINFGEFRNSKVVFAILEALNFVTFGEFQPSKSAKINKKSKLRYVLSMWCDEMADFGTTDSPILISRKI